MSGALLCSDVRGSSWALSKLNPLIVVPGLLAVLFNYLYSLGPPLVESLRAQLALIVGSLPPQCQALFRPLLPGINLRIATQILAYI
jgi:hypothetical protein